MRLVSLAVFRVCNFVVLCFGVLEFAVLEVCSCMLFRMLMVFGYVRLIVLVVVFDFYLCL